MTINISILGLFLILVVIAFYLYLCKTPLDIRKVFYNKKKKSHISNVKFKNSAPSAPDLLFGNDSYELPKYEQKQAKPSFTVPQSNNVQPTAFQQELAQILWYKNQLSTVYLDDTDMVIVKNNKTVGLIRCIEKGRIHTGHIDDIFTTAKKLKVRTIYLLALGKIDRSAFKLAVRKNIRFITQERLDSLRAKYPLEPVN